MGVASFCGAFWGLVARPVFSGVPLGVLGAALGDVRTGGGFWVAGAGLRRSGARSGRSGLGFWHPVPLWVLGARSGAGAGVPISATENRTRVRRSVLGWGSGGAPLGLGLRAENITEGAQVVSVVVVSVSVPAAGVVEADNVVAETLHLGGSIRPIDAGMFTALALALALGFGLALGLHGILQSAPILDAVLCVMVRGAARPRRGGGLLGG